MSQDQSEQAITWGIYLRPSDQDDLGGTYVTTVEAVTQADAESKGQEVAAQSYGMRNNIGVYAYEA